MSHERGHRYTVKVLERIAVALEARVVAPTQDVADLVDNLQAEVATLKALNAGQHAEKARTASRHREQLAEGGAVNARLMGERDAAWRTVTALQEQVARAAEERDVLRKRVAELEQNIYLGLIPPSLRLEEK